MILLTGKILLHCTISSKTSERIKVYHFSADLTIPSLATTFPCARGQGAHVMCVTLTAVSQPGHVRRAGAGVIGVFRFITSSGQGAPPGAAF